MNFALKKFKSVDRLINMVIPQLNRLTIWVGGDPTYLLDQSTQVCAVLVS